MLRTPTILIQQQQQQQQREQQQQLQHVELNYKKKKINTKKSSSSTPATSAAQTLLQRFRQHQQQQHFKQQQQQQQPVVTAIDTIKYLEPATNCFYNKQTTISDDKSIKNINDNNKNKITTLTRRIDEATTVNNKFLPRKCLLLLTTAPTPKEQVAEASATFDVAATSAATATATVKTKTTTTRSLHLTKNAFSFMLRTKKPKRIIDNEVVIKEEEELQKQNIETISEKREAEEELITEAPVNVIDISLTESETETIKVDNDDLDDTTTTIIINNSKKFKINENQEEQKEELKTTKSRLTLRRHQSKKLRNSCGGNSAETLSNCSMTSTSSTSAYSSAGSTIITTATTINTASPIEEEKHLQQQQKLLLQPPQQQQQQHQQQQPQLRKLLLEQQQEKLQTKHNKENSSPTIKLKLNHINNNRGLNNLIMSPTSQAPTRTSLFDSCHRKIRLIGGGPVAFLGGLVAKARRKERDGDQNSTDTKLYLEESVLERKLPEADLKALVDLPGGLDFNEWLASHTLALFEHVNLVYGTISEFCTPSGCADMTGPGNRTYLWFDEKGKKTRVAAPQYIDYVMTFTQKTVSDESIFPTKYANEFPSSFEVIVRKILRLQFHVIAHLYAAHFREIALLGLHTHLNLTFAHLTALHRRFTLIEEKETDVLRDLEVALRLTDDNNGCGVSGNGSSGSGNNSQSQQQQDTNSTATATTTTTITNDSATSSLSMEQQHNNSTSNYHVNSSLIAATSLIDGDSEAPPICTQPEAGSKQTTSAHHPVFGGGSNLMGGILGDLTSGEFGDTTRYCTSAVPQQTTTATTDPAAAAAMNNGGAGALHLNFNNNNNNNNHHPHTHHHHVNHHHYHGHHHPHHHYHGGHQQQLQQNSGLIQCNAAGAGQANNATATASSATNSSSTSTTTA